jgi:hypothetical protein
MATIHKRSAEFARLMEEKGLHTLVLKGIAVSTYYPNPLHREFGDLDCYLFEGNPENTIIWENCYEKGNVAGETAGCGRKNAGGYAVLYPCVVFSVV